MINIGYDLLAEVAVKKINFCKKLKFSYFISSTLAGLFVGLCVITILVMASMLNDFAGIKILQGISFAAALSLVVFAGAELFTGNVFVMLAGILMKTIKTRDALILLLICYIGNFIGSIFIASLFWGTGYLKDFVLLAARDMIFAKTAPLISELFVRGILCNILVCLATWCVYRMQSESGKLVMIFWAIYLFVVCGFEHSIANMTLFSLGIIKGTIGLMPMVVNLVTVTAGNILGGVLLSLAYWSIGRKTP